MITNIKTNQIKPSIKITALKMRSRGQRYAQVGKILSLFAHFSSLNSVSDAADLEAEKRREYEEWFKLQEKEALEYSACVKYQEKIGESEDLTDSQQQSVTTTEAKVKTGRIVLTVVHSLTLPPPPV